MRWRGPQASWLVQRRVQMAFRELQPSLNYSLEGQLIGAIDLLSTKPLDYTPAPASSGCKMGPSSRTTSLADKQSAAGHRISAANNLSYKLCGCCFSYARQGVRWRSRASKKRL
jgi:hypothetical protein